MSRSRVTVTLACALLLALPHAARAWWEDGHSVVCKIAEAYLTPEARTAIKELLGETAMSDPEVCVWADRIIGKSPELDAKYPNHRTWHYINLELQLKEADFRPDLKGDNVIGAIERCRTVLANKEAAVQDRKEALMFLVHFVGDMHQPLHCSNRNDDKGGNMQPVKSFLGMTEEKLNLHKVWDGYLVNANRGLLTVEDYAQRCKDEITEVDRTTWKKGEVKNWAWESHLLGISNVYRLADESALPNPDAPPVELTDENYVKMNRPVVHQQLKKAGVRLAMLLNDCLAKKE